MIGQPQVIVGAEKDYRPTVQDDPGFLGGLDAAKKTIAVRRPEGGKAIFHGGAD